MPEIPYSASDPPDGVSLPLTIDRVIIPVVRSKLLDRTMLYTAITRGIETVVLVGDIEFINEVISAAPASLARDTALCLC